MFSARTNVEGTRASSGSCVRFECRFYTDVAPVVLEERRRKSDAQVGRSGSSVCFTVCHDESWVGFFRKIGKSRGAAYGMFVSCEHRKRAMHMLCAGSSTVERASP